MLTIYQRAIDKWGADHQKIVAVGELNELASALSHNYLGRDNPLEIAEEMADVYIALAQVEMIFGNAQQVQEYKAKKLHRLQARIDEGDEHGPT